MSYLPPEEVVVAYLTGQCGLLGVTVQDPQDILADLPWAKVTRIGGPTYHIWDEGIVNVHVFHTDRAHSLATMGLVHTRMLQLRGQQVQGCVIDDVECLSGPHWEDYGDENVKRYVASYIIVSRLGIPLSVIPS